MSKKRGLLNILFVAFFLGVAWPAHSDYGTASFLRSQEFTDFVKRSHFTGRVVRGSRFILQTGRYAQVTVNPEWAQRPCVKEILAAGEMLAKDFPDFSFSIDGRIQNCERLESAAQAILAGKEKITENLRRIHSPLHSIFLSVESKFNHYNLDELGLHIAIEREGEIQARLIDFQIKPGDIPHEALRASELKRFERQLTL